MTKLLLKFKGKVGEVIMVDKEGDVKVKFGGSSFFINPICLALQEKKRKVRVEGNVWHLKNQIL